MMKKIIYVMICTLLAVSLMEARPKLVFSSGNVHDFGVVRQKDSPLKADITIYNKGNDTLIIDRVKPTCGCTTAPLSKKVIAPNDSAILKVTLNVEHYEGTIEKRIIIFSNNNDEYTLSLKADIYKPIALFPGKYFNFNQMYIGDETISKIVITNMSNRDINVVNLVKPDDMELNIKIGDIIPKDSDYVVEAKLTPTVVGHYTAKIDLFIDDPDMPLIQLTGLGKVDAAEAKAIDFHKEEATIETLENSNMVNPPVIEKPNAPISIQPGAPMPVEQVPNMVVPENKIQLPKLPDQNELIKRNNEIKVEPLESPKVGKPVEKGKEGENPEKK